MFTKIAENSNPERIAIHKNDMKYYFYKSIIELSMPMKILTYFD